MSTDGSERITKDGVLQVYSAGSVTVLGFGGQDVPTDFNAAEYRTAISEVLTGNDCRHVAFDMSGVKLVPSGILGLWLSLHNQGIKVEIFNPSDDVREVLELTKVGDVLDVKEVEL